MKAILTPRMLFAALALGGMVSAQAATDTPAKPAATKPAAAKPMAKRRPRPRQR